MTASADTVIAAYVKLRDKKHAAQATFNKYVSELDAKMDRLEAWLLENMDKMGASQFKADAGVAYVQVKTKASCSDWPLLWNHLKENGRFDLLEKRLSSKTVGQYLEETGELPPGVNVSRERSVVVRKG